MLEVLLFTYSDQFGEDFPLSDFTDLREIDVINLLYECIQNNTPYQDGMHAKNLVTGAPGQK